MKKFNVLAWRGLAAVLPMALAGALAMSPQTAAAFEPPPRGVGLCLGTTITPYFADVVDSNAGSELIVTDVTEAVLADSDVDGFVQVRSILKVRAFDRSGNELWASPRLTVLSRDVATAVDGQGLFPNVLVFPGVAADAFASPLIFGGLPCYENIFAVEANGNKYLAVVGGAVTQTGQTEADAIDQSLLKLWLLNRSTGAIVAEHTINKRQNRILAAVSLSGIGPVDGDADDELVLAYVKVNGDGKYRLFYETRNILTGAVEETFDVPLNNIRRFP